MKKRNFVFSLLLAVVCVLGVAAILVSVTGCEIESADKVDVRVTPAQANISRGQSIELTASGWEDFRWRLSNPRIGHLSATVGLTVVYTATRAGNPPDDPSVVEQVVTATAIRQAQAQAQGAETNRVAGFSATSRIRHL